MTKFAPKHGYSPISIVIGLAGGAAVVGLSLTHVHATTDGRVLDCGRFLTSWTNGSLGRPCRSALNARFNTGFAFVLPVVAAAWVVQLCRNAYLSRRAPEAAGTPRSDFRVGAHVGRHGTRSPLARLSITPGQMVIRSLGGSAVVQRPTVQAVREVRTTFGAEIVFDTIDGSGTGLKIYSRKPDEILAAFSRLGWPASRE
jgi:hypothetical protein